MALVHVKEWLENGDDNASSKYLHKNDFTSSHKVYKSLVKEALWTGKVFTPEFVVYLQKVDSAIQITSWKKEQKLSGKEGNNKT